MKKKLILVLILLVSACTKTPNGLDGTYSNGTIRLTFAQGTVSTVILGTKVAAPYKVKDGKIEFSFAGGGGHFVLTRQADGSLSAPVFGKFAKMPNN